MRLITADVMEGLRQLADESIHCVVTSPPYWGLRSYLPAGHPRKHDEIGSEPTLQEHIARLVEVFSEVRRVLRQDGTLWLNYGDMWAGSWGAQSRGDYTPGTTTGSGLSAQQIAAAQKGTKTGSIKRTGLKAKNLCMAPHRLAIALQDDGWWVRSDIVWHKPNPMPSSVRDRPTPAKEFVFLLSKAPRYHYDADAIAEPATYATPNAPDKIKSPMGQGFTRRASMTNDAARPPGTAPHKGLAGKNENSGDRRREGFNGQWDEVEATGAYALTRNARDVWTIATEPFKEAHYATFPKELARRCILAGCPAGGTVLDPFGGSGTVGLVADHLQRHAILIDLDERNRPMAERRLAADAPLLIEIEMAN